MIKGWERWEFQPLFPAVDNVAVPLRVFRPAPHRQYPTTLCNYAALWANSRATGTSPTNSRVVAASACQDTTEGKLLLVHIYCLPATASAGTGTAHSELRLSFNSIHNKYS